MIPILYASTARGFSSHGLGDLTDAIKCEVRHEINGEYELALEYPLSGDLYAAIAAGCIIKAKPDKYTEAQPFRIYRISRPISGRVTVYARHISYDMAGIGIKPFTASGLQAALAAIPSNAVGVSQFDFVFSTPRSLGAEFAIDAPRSLWRLVGGEAGSLLDVYGGEWDFDGYNATLKTALGADRGVVIEYGKNLLDITAERDASGDYTAVYPYWSDGEGVVITLPEAVIGTGRCYTLDTSDYFDTAPTEAQLRARAQAWLASIDTTETVTVKFALLENSSEYAGLENLETVALGDTVRVRYTALGVDVKKRANAVRWDVLLDRYFEVTLGSVKSNLADVLASTQEAVKAAITRSKLEQAINGAAAKITGQTGGYVRINTTDDGHPYEILIMDAEQESDAANIWRWNVGGLAHSGDGGATYNTAITQDGEIIGEFIAAGSVTAARIDIDGVADAMESYFSATREGVLLTVSEQYATTSDRDATNGNLADLKAQIDTHFYFTNSGLTIKGTAGSGDAYVTISADKQIFYQSGAAVLTLDANGINAPNAVISGDVSAKTVTIAPWQWFVDGNGVLTLGRNN